MPDKATVVDSVERYLKARVPLIVIQSYEPNRVMEVLSECASTLSTMQFYEHSRTEGVRDLLSSQSVSDETSLVVALEHARTTFKARTNVNFIFTDVDELDQETSQSKATLPRWSDWPNPAAAASSSSRPNRCGPVCLDSA